MGREVLISPYSVKAPIGSDGAVAVSLTRGQVEASPDIDTHQPVSRQHEFEYRDYYGYGDYWYGVDLWGISAYPVLPLPPPPGEAAGATERWRDAPEASLQDVHLRSTESVTGYHVQASDDGIEHVQDFIFEDASWAIRYLVVDTRDWWPGGRKVLVSTRWIDRIDWADRKVFTSLTREAVKASPEYEESAAIEREYETRLHDSYGLPAYHRRRPRRRGTAACPNAQTAARTQRRLGHECQSRMHKS